jgi:hypothetical protein
MAESKYSSTNDSGACVNDVCTSQGLSDRQSAFDIARVSTFTLLGGVALVGVGAVLYLSAPVGKSPRSALAVGPTLTGGGGGLVLRGSL